MSRNLFLTSRPGAGKTTAIQRALGQLSPVRLGGFTTAEIRDERGRLGFYAAGLDGPRIVLAHVRLRSPHRVGRYGVDVTSFERDIVPLLDPRRHDVDLFVVDEIGKMECFSPRFRAVILELLEDPRPVLGTIALRGSPFIEQVRRRPDVRLVEVTPSNRDSLPDLIAALVRPWLDNLPL